MATGDFATTDFTAAAPYTYNHDTGGGAYNDRTVGDQKDITEQLEGGQFAFGDVVSYLVQVTMAGTTVDDVQTAEFDFGFLAESTGQTGAAQVKILNVGVNYGDVENGDNGTGLNPGEDKYGFDSGISDDKQNGPLIADKNGIKGSTAILVPGSEKIVKPSTGQIVAPYTPGAELRGTIRVNDLEAGEKIVLRIDVLLEGKPGTSPTGNLQGALLGGRTYKPDGTLLGNINTGNQTIPFLKIGEIAGAGAPLLDIQKTVTTDLSGTDKTGVESLTINGSTTVRYLYNVTNDGTMPLYDLTIKDDNGTPGNTTDDFTVNLNNKLSGNLVNLDGEAVTNDLAAGESAIFYADIPLNKTGSVTNIGTATGNNNLNGGNRVELTDTDTANVKVEGTPSLNIIKTADLTSVNQAGEVITYTYQVQNTGTLPLTGITVKDDNHTPLNTEDDITLITHSGDVNNNNQLDVGETWTYTSTYTVTQANIDAGNDLVNIATADSNETEPDTDDAKVNVIKNADLFLEKVADVTQVDAVGDVINYTYTVDNTGNIPLSGITLKDDNFTPGNASDDFDPTYQSGDVNNNQILDTNETWTYTASHTVTQADLDKGGDLVNIATADSTESDPSIDDASVDILQTPELTLVKTANPSQVNAAGQDITYTYTVQNTGNISLTNVNVIDDNFTPENAADDFPPTLSTNGDGDAVLDVGETWTYTYTHSVTQADIDSGKAFVNVATADSDQTDPTTDDETVTVQQIPNFEVIKTADVTEVDGAGDVINYTYTIANTGNVTLSDVYLVDDNFTPENAEDDFNPILTSGDNGNGVLDIGETWTYTAAYTVTQADIDNGLALTNVVTADTAQTNPATDEETVEVIQNPLMQVIKTADVQEVDGAGDVINYTYTLSNRGNVSLNDVVLVDDNFTPDDTSDDVTLTPTGDNGNKILDVGETWTYTHQYTVTQADIDAGLDLTNVATATSTEAPPTDDDETVDVEYNPDLTIQKTADITEVDAAGAQIQYTYTVTNTGNVTLENVDLTDDNFTPDDASDDFDPTFDSGDTNNNGKLDVGETWTYTANYTVTQADIDAGKDLVNVVVADTNQTEPKEDDYKVNVIQEADLFILKESDVTSVDAAGDVITYNYTVQNTGNTTLTNVTLTDDNFTPTNPGDDFNPTLIDDGDGNDELNVQETWRYQDTYTVTQADMDSGVSLVNIATADSDQTEPQTDDATVDIDQNPDLSVVKEANVTEVDAVGDVIQYTYTVSNTGNVTLENITLRDDHFTPGDVSDDFDPTFDSGDSNSNGKLDVGENWTYTASHTVTQADLNQGQPLVNIVTADSNLTDPTTDDAKVDVIVTPNITIDKVTSNNIVTGDGIGVTANTPVSWIYTVTNTGNIDLSEITVTDDPEGSITNITNNGNGDSILSPNEIWTFQANGTAITGSYENTGTVTGSYPNGDVTDADTSSYTGLTAPGVRTPGFWVNWPEVWDGNATNDKRFAGRSGFPISDILLEPYSNSEQAPKVVDPVTGQYTTGLLVGDYNRDGLTNNGEKTIFYTLDEAKSIVGASNKVQADKRYTLDRSLVASWLNYLGFNPAPVNDINNGIAWLQQHSPDENADGIGDGNLVLNASTYGFPASSPYWNQASGGLPSGSSINNALDSYNNGLWSPV